MVDELTGVLASVNSLMELVPVYTKICTKFLKTKQMLLFAAGIEAYFIKGLENENDETDQRKRQLINGCQGRACCPWLVLKGHR